MPQHPKRRETTRQGRTPRVSAGRMGLANSIQHLPRWQGAAGDAAASVPLLAAPSESAPWVFALGLRPLRRP
jgi:hypothetical protein